MVEWVGLVASGFQFLLGLAAVFAEEFGGFGLLELTICRLREALFQNKFYRVKLFTIGFLRKNSGKTKKELEAAGN